VAGGRRFFVNRFLARAFTDCFPFSIISPCPAVIFFGGFKGGRRRGSPPPLAKFSALKKVRFLVDKCLIRAVYYTQKGGDFMYIKARKVIARIAKKYDVPVREIIGRSREKTIVHARRIAIRFCVCETPYSLTELGKVFGGRDRATILSYLHVVPDGKSENAS
jgi:hypothetical protein